MADTNCEKLKAWWERVDAVLLGNVWIGGCDGKDTVELDFDKASQAQPDRLLQFATILASRAKSLRVKARFEHLILLALCTVPLFRGIPVTKMFRLMMEKSFRSDQERDLEAFLKGVRGGPRKFTRELYMRGFACGRKSLVILLWGRGLAPYDRLGNTYGESLDYYMRRLEKPSHREKLPPWPKNFPMAQPYLIHKILSTSLTCAQICQELSYSDHALSSTSSIVHSISNKASQNCEIFDDQQSVDESDTDRQQGKGRQDAGIIQEEGDQLISGHEFWDIDD